MTIADLDDPDANSCVGNHYSKAVAVTLERSGSEKIVEVVADQVRVVVSFEATWEANCVTLTCTVCGR